MGEKCLACGGPLGGRWGNRCYRCNGKPKIGTPESRFWAKVDKRGPDECWEWQGTRNAKGYGQFRPYGKYGRTGPVVWKAARFSYVLVCGPIPKGKYVCHHCDNPPCCNPAHLFVGSHQDNVDDRERKGRNVVRSGAAAPGARLTEEQVAEIRRRVAAGEPQKPLAVVFGVSRSTISNVVRRRCYA